MIAREQGQQFKTLGSNALTIGRTGYRPYIAGMPKVSQHVASRQGIRDLHRMVFAARGDALAIGRTGHAIGRFGLPPVGKKSASGRGIFTVSTLEPLHIVQLS